MCLSCTFSFCPFYNFPLFLSMGWYCGAEVFGLIGCKPLSLSVALRIFLNNSNNIGHKFLYKWTIHGKSPSITRTQTPYKIKENICKFICSVIRIEHPIPKGPPSSSASNYRPISLTPILSDNSEAANGELSTVRRLKHNWQQWGSWSSSNFNARILKFPEKFDHPFSHVFMFIAISLYFLCIQTCSHCQQMYSLPFYISYNTCISI